MAEFDRYAGFEKMRTRVKQDVDASKQQMGEAIQRRFAAMGNLNSGAHLKVQQKANDAADVQARAATEGVDFAEQQERGRQADITQAQTYQTGEREAAQKFQGDLQRGMFESDMAFKREAFGKQHDLALKEFAASMEANDINAIIGLANAEIDSETYNQFRDLLTSMKSGQAAAIRPPPGADLSRQPENGFYWVPEGMTGRWVKGR